MIEFIAVVILLIVIWFFLKIRNKKSSNATPKNILESAKPIQQEPKPADKIVSATESVAPPLTSTQENIPAPSKPAQQSNQPVESEQASHKVVVSPENSNKNLPQDSMLKRHYLAHLRAMIISLSPPRPTDSALARHYDTQIAAKIEQCLNDESALQQLIFHYEHNKTTPAHTVVQEPQTTIITSSPTPTPESEETADETAVLVEPVNASNIPEDSMLRRHYLTNLHTQIGTNLPLRPTDSMLRRHYDALLENTVKTD